jgi:hypothetical protein
MFDITHFVDSKLAFHGCSLGTGSRHLTAYHFQDCDPFPRSAVDSRQPKECNGQFHGGKSGRNVVEFLVVQRLIILSPVTSNITSMICVLAICLTECDEFVSEII